MIAQTPQDLSDLIGRIYDCTLDPSLWEPTLDEIRRVLQARTCQFGLLDIVRARALIAKEHGIDDRMRQLIQANMGDVNAAIEGVLDDGHSLDEPIIVQRDAPAKFLASAYARGLASMGLCDVAQINIVRMPTRISFVGWGRDESAGVYGDREIEILRLLIPHLRRAVTISDVLDAKSIEAERMSDALDALNLGVVLANEDTKIVHANRAAEAMMRADGPIRGVKGRMCAERPAASAELKEAVIAAARNESGIGRTGLAVRLTENYEQPVVAHVLPLANGRVRTRLEPEAVAAIFINTPVDESNCANAVTAAYKLTPAESRVLQPILAGRTVPEAAADAGVATTTARTHLNNIFAKTGVSRQSDLIRLAAAVAPAAQGIAS